MPRRNEITIIKATKFVKTAIKPYKLKKLSSQYW